jgi:hypothetical protein
MYSNQRFGRSNPYSCCLLQGKRIKYFQIYRWDPEQSSKPSIATYPIDLGDCGPMVSFDALELLLSHNDHENIHLMQT